MANILANANGNFSNPATWVGGVVPGPGDNVYSNNKTITLDTDITVTKLCNKPENGAAAYGYFTVSGSRTINANIDGGNGSVLYISSLSPAVVTITGSVIGARLETSFSGTLNVIGNVFSTGSNTAGTNHGIHSYAGSTGSISVTGDVSAFTGTVANYYGIYLEGTQVVTVNGNLMAESQQSAIYSFNSNSTITVNGVSHTANSNGKLFTLGGTGGSIEITGSLVINSSSNWAQIYGSWGGTWNLTGITYLVSNPTYLIIDGSASFIINGNMTWPDLGSSSVNALIDVRGNAQLTINGNITSVNGYDYMITMGGYSTDSPTVTINGDLRGNDTYSYSTISCSSTLNATITVNGTVTAGDDGPAIATSASDAKGTVFCDKVVGNGYGPGAPVTISKVSAITSSAPLFKVAAKQLQYGSRGNAPTSCLTFIDQDPANTIELELEDNVTNVVFVPGLVSQDYPAPVEVLNGVSYGFGAFTGTMIQYNVVDTATLITEMKTEGISTVESVGSQLATFGA